MVVRRAPPPTDDAGEGLLDGASRRSGCSTKDVDDGGPLPWGCLAALGLANAAEAVEVLCTSYLLTGIPAAASRAAVSSGVYCGMLVGGVGGGVLADGARWGGQLPRTRVLVGAMALACLGGLGASTARSAADMCFWRVLAGAGVGAATPPLFALAAEVSDGPKRGRGIAFVASFWMVGGVFAAALAMGLLPDDLRVDWSASAAAPWRVYAACSALPSAASGVVFLARGAGERKVLDAAARAPPADGARASSERDERRRVFLFLAVAFWGLYFGYYGLATWITVIVDEAHIGNTYVVALYYAAANLPGNVAAYALIDAVGRQRLLAGAMGTATLACVLLAVSLGGEADGLAAWEKTAAVAAALLVNAATTAGFSALDALAAESFDAARRATHVGLLCAIGRVASISAQLVNSTLAESPALLVAVTSALMCLGALATFGIREPADVVGGVAADGTSAGLV